MKNNFIRLAGILFLIGAISAGVLAWLNDTTKDIIAQNEAMASMDPAILEAVMPGSVMFYDYEDTALVETVKSENQKVINIMTAVDASGNESVGKLHFIPGVNNFYAVIIFLKEFGFRKFWMFGNFGQ